MYKWEENDNQDFEISIRELGDPIYGFYNIKKTGRAISIADSEGFSQFHISLVDHKNETPNIEYNPMDVFMNGKKLNQNERKAQAPKKQSNTKSGYQLYSKEVRPSVQRMNPDAPFGAITKQVAQMWNELTPIEQEEYCQRARSMPDAPEDGTDQLGGPELYFNMGGHPPHQDDGGPSLYTLNLGA